MMAATCRRVFFLGIILLVVFCSCCGAESLTGEVREITLYREQALVTRVLTVQGPRGLTEVVVGSLPNQIIAGTLSADCGSNGQVHSVTYRTRAVSTETREDVRAIDDGIRATERELREVQSQQQLLVQKQAIIAHLENFTAESSERELQQGILDFEQLYQLTDFVLREHAEFAEEALKLDEKRRILLETVALLKRRRGELAAGSGTVQREAIIHITKDTDDDIVAFLHYGVRQVNWYPQYNLRFDSTGSTLMVEYTAVVKQMSGEDWHNVHCTLSTAAPTFSAEPPRIEPLNIVLGPKVKLEAEQVKEAIGSLRKQRSTLQHEPGAPRDVSEMLNVYANEEQVLELTQKADMLTAGTSSTYQTEGVSVTYELPYGVNVVSRAEEQVLQIDVVSFAASMLRVAVPVLTDYVYRQVAFVNTSSVVFLPGSYSAYLDGEFVGQGTLKLLASGEQIDTGLGVDPQVRVRKNLVSKDQHVEGGNLVTDFSYEISVENFRGNDFPMQLHDRIPHSEDGSIKVVLLEVDPPLSTDAQHEKAFLTQGLLRWDLPVSGADMNEDTFTIRYRFEVAHDKQLAITGSRSLD